MWFVNLQGIRSNFITVTCVIKGVQLCQYLSINVKNVGTKRNFWKRRKARRSTFAKNAAVKIYRKCFQLFLERAAPNLPVVIVAQQEHAHSIKKD